MVEAAGHGHNRVETAGFSQPYPVELRTFRTNDALLQRVQGTTGGRVLSSPADTLAPLKDRGASITPLWTIFLSIALALLPLDIAFRRLAIPLPELWAAAAAGAKSLLHRRRARRTPKAAPVRVHRLHEAKRRGAAKSSPAPAPVPAGEAPKVAPKPLKATVPTDEPVEPVGTGSSTAHRLLEAKRRRTK